MCGDCFFCYFISGDFLLQRNHKYHQNKKKNFSLVSSSLFSCSLISPSPPWGKEFAFTLLQGRLFLFGVPKSKWVLALRIPICPGQVSPHPSWFGNKTLKSCPLRKKLTWCQTYPVINNIDWSAYSFVLKIMSFQLQPIP